MPRASRKQSEGDIYHVYARGVGRQLIFEDDKDYAFFLNTLGRLLSEDKGKLLAWALMGNHFHLLLNMPLDSLSEFMRDLQTTYAQRFNKRYGRTGHLFQGRFGSQPITSEEQLLACVRYIHRNPVEAKLSKTCNYKWSSYRSYLRGAAVTETSFVLEMFGGVKMFKDFHMLKDCEHYSFIDVEDGESEQRFLHMTDSQACEIGASILGDAWRQVLPSLPRDQRDDWLRQLKNEGLSVRQIERLTGIGRSIIARA